MPEVILNDIHSRIVRHNEMAPCKTAFIDSRTPGSDKKENYCLIGGGVSENPDQKIHITIPHGFNVGAAKQPRGCKNSHHSHDTAEVFFVHHGEWKFSWGQDGGDGEIILHKGETISIPTQVFRGFENAGADDGFLLAVLGIDEHGTPGHVIWAPYVFENAKSHGLVLLGDGRLIDTHAGGIVPEDVEVVGPPSETELLAYHRLSVEDMRACVQRVSDLASANTGGLDGYDGVFERAVLGKANERESIGAGKINWEHGFHVRRLELQAGANIPAHARAEEEVLFVHLGSLSVTILETQFTLNPGDLFTVPVGAAHSFSNPGSERADIVVIRGGAHPEAARMAA